MELVSRLFLSDNRFSQTLLLKHFARPFFYLAFKNLFKVFGKHFVLLRYSNGVLANFIGLETWAPTRYVVSVNCALYSSVLSGIRSYFKLILIIHEMSLK